MTLGDIYGDALRSVATIPQPTPTRKKPTQKWKRALFGNNRAARQDKPEDMFQAGMTEKPAKKGKFPGRRDNCNRMHGNLYDQLFPYDWERIISDL